MKLAFYKGPPTDFWHRVGHWFTKLFTASEYSHVELVINGTAYSASSRDGGVRTKQLDLTTGKWDVVELTMPDPLAAADAHEWFCEHAGQGYDYAGALRFALPFIPQNHRQWFCSEACAAALGLDSPHKYSPEGLFEWSLSHA